jgi:YD repeat-containing protein
MKSRYLFLFICCALPAAGLGQHVHTKTTWVYEENDTTGQVTSTVIYDPAGHVIKKQDGEEMLVTFAYDSAGRVTSHTTIYRSQERSCQLAYSDHRRTITCSAVNENGIHSFDVTTDSTSADSLLLWSRYKSSRIENGDTLMSVYNFTLYTYDQHGNQLSEISYDESGQVVNWQKKSYTITGKLLTSRNGVGANDWCQDSTAYLYDDQDRLIRIKRFQYRRSGGYAVTTSILITYDEHFTSAENNPLNGKLILQNAASLAMDQEFYPTHYPASVRITVNDIDEPQEKANTDLAYYYAYDDKGRLTYITGTGYSPYNDKVDTDIEVAYYDSTTVVYYYGVNYTGARVSAKTETYENGILSMWFHNSEWGFPLRTTKYVFTFYP